MADALGWGRFDLVGHDWGAAVAWIVAAKNARRVRSLTAVSVPHLGAFAEALRTDPVQQEASTYMDDFRQPAPGPENMILASGPLKLPGVDPAKCAKYFRRLSQPGALTAALNWYRANDFEGYEQRVAVPTLFIASRKDPMVAPSGVQATKNWVTGPYRLENLADIGHFIPEEAPAVTNKLLLTHLASVRS
jgi:pimeloyl-ACP methyl ester carboxylesterase